MKNIIIVLICAVFLMSCATQGPKQNQGTAVGGVTGAAVGAGLGQAIGGNTESTLWGAAIGAAVGALAGNQIGAYMDRQQAAMQNAMASTIAANQASVNRASENMLMATFKSDVFFDVNSSAIKPGGYNELTRVSNVLNQYPQTNIQVQGHTDRSGSEEYNRVLSQRRAETVQAVLMQNGVDPRRMTSIGLGESQPISSDPSQNRRVTLVLTPISNG
jgi:outer membrane protein OmpA-like peptidoglycan-associated protein